MSGALTAAGVVVAVGDVSLIVGCWKSRTVLGGVLGACGVPLVAFAISAGSSRRASEEALLIAAIALVIGTALYALGQVFDRLLDDESEDEVRHRPARRRGEETNGAR